MGYSSSGAKNFVDSFNTIRGTCKHPNAYFAPTAGTDLCPDCNSLRRHGFLNKLTGERMGGGISGELADELRAKNALDFWEEWVPAPGTPVRSKAGYNRHIRDLSRSFAPEYRDYGEI